mmetsp:Transcript_10049/g.40589  ORF Transcript_10049/g.40589 Transcript_10049/m.40589 type:complete len:207 (+) Transcript_10049:435-1055(+)
MRGLPQRKARGQYYLGSVVREGPGAGDERRVPAHGRRLQSVDGRGRRRVGLHGAGAVREGRDAPRGQRRRLPSGAVASGSSRGPLHRPAAELLHGDVAHRGGGRFRRGRVRQRAPGRGEGLWRLPHRGPQGEGGGRTRSADRDARGGDARVDPRGRVRHHGMRRAVGRVQLAQRRGLYEAGAAQAQRPVGSGEGAGAGGAPKGLVR